MADLPQQPEWGIKLSKFFVVPQRWILAIMGFFAIFNAYTMRVCLSQAITVLVVKKNYTDKPQGESICEADEDSQGPISREGGSYEWSEDLRLRLSRPTNLPISHPAQPPHICDSTQTHSYSKQ